MENFPNTNIFLARKKVKQFYTKPGSFDFPKISFLQCNSENTWGKHSSSWAKLLVFKEIPLNIYRKRWKVEKETFKPVRATFERLVGKQYAHLTNN